MTNPDDFQRRSSEEGRAAQDIAEKVITGAGFSIRNRPYRIPNLGVTLNFEAEDTAGNSWVFDVSGSFTSPRAGLIRTDTMWKTLGRANVLHESNVTRLLLLTTNLPKEGSAGDKAMRAASTTFFDAVEMISAEGKLRLRQYASGNTDSKLPLPGYRTVRQIYGAAVRFDGGSGALSVPVNLTGDPIPVKTTFDVTEMPHRFKVFLPSLDDNGDTLSVAERRRVGRRIVELLSAEAGGCTASNGLGSWVDPISGLVQEEVVTFEAYSRKNISPKVVGDILGLIVDDLRQSAAAIIINDRMYHFSR